MLLKLGRYHANDLICPFIPLNVPSSEARRHLRWGFPGKPLRDTLLSTSPLRAVLIPVESNTKRVQCFLPLLSPCITRTGAPWGFYNSWEMVGRLALHISELFRTPLPPGPRNTAGYTHGARLPRWPLASTLAGCRAASSVGGTSAPTQPATGPEPRFPSSGARTCTPPTI